MNGCITCELGLDHCHGLLVEHADGTHECTEGCGGPKAVHDAVLAPAAAPAPVVVLADAA